MKINRCTPIFSVLVIYLRKEFEYFAGLLSDKGEIPRKVPILPAFRSLWMTLIITLILVRYFFQISSLLLKLLVTLLICYDV